MVEDNPEEPSDSTTPLDELRRSIEDQTSPEPRRPEIWEVLEGRFDDEPVEETVLESEKVDRSVPDAASMGPSVQSMPTENEPERRWIPSYPSQSVYVFHGVLTALIFIASFGIYVGAVLSLIPRHLWIVSLPLFALGVFFLTPIFAWSLGIWNPKESI